MLACSLTLSCAAGTADGGDESLSGFGPGGNNGSSPGDGTAGSVGGLTGGADDGDTDGMTSGVGGNDGANCVDNDGDSYGTDCTAGEDCDDDNPDVNPGADETCNGNDDNCDGMIDNGCDCPADGVSGTCDAPTDLGVLMPGDTAMGVVGNVPQEGSLDWYKISFPSGVRPGEGMPTLSFSVNEGDAFVFDIVGAQCEVTGLACSSGGTGGAAIALTDWSFVDDVPDCCTPPNDSMVPWPNEVFIRVYRTTMGASCATYQLQASR